MSSKRNKIPTLDGHKDLYELFDEQDSLSTPSESADDSEESFSRMLEDTLSGVDQAEIIRQKFPDDEAQGVKKKRTPFAGSPQSDLDLHGYHVSEALVRVETFIETSALQGLEDDPKALGSMMKKMGREMGEELPPEFDDMVDRLEAGQSPEEIESAMPDLGGDAGGSAGMDDDLFILPGHYLDWSEANPDNVFVDTMGSIKTKNANIYGIAEEDEFVRFIEDNMRKQPDVYGEIRKVNAGMLEVDDEEQEVMDLGKMNVQPACMVRSKPNSEC